MGASKHMGTSKHKGQSEVCGIWTPLSATKHAFFVLCVYIGHPNIFQTYGGIKIYGASTNIWKCPHIQRASKQGVPHMFGFPLYIHNTKKACFVRLRRCPYAPISLDTPICLNGPLYAWMPPICLPVCLDTPICLDGPVH